jgi:hypothetical protein
MYIKWGKEKSNASIQFPVIPENYSLNGKQQNTSVNVHAFGEINLKGKRALASVSWSSFFPAQEYDFLHGTFKDPVKFYVVKLEDLMEKNTTIHLVIGNRLNIFGTIESFTWGEEERNGDVSYSITIKEYRAPGDGTRLKQYSDGSVSYVWKKGDTWKKVCKKQLGTNEASVVKNNRKANKSVINKAIKAYKKKNPKVKKVKENTALIGCKVVLKK